MKAPLITSDIVQETLIVGEASHVRTEQYKIIRGQYNNTLTFDGGSTKKKCSVYTVHVTMADRAVYCVRGEDDTDHKHTGEYLATKLNEVCEIDIFNAL